MADPDMTAIEEVAGPYERWVFTPELGRPFAFSPELSAATHYTAIVEGGATPPAAPGMETRVPPLWEPNGVSRKVTPFAFHKPTSGAPNVDELATMLADMQANYGGPATFRVNFPIAPSAWASNYDGNTGLTGWTAPATKPKVIVGVIDDGLPFGHRAFMDSAGQNTRIAACWLQGAPGVATTSPVPFGREYLNSEINALHAQSGNDDAAFYRLAGADQPEAGDGRSQMLKPVTHGAHVMGLAAGNDTVFAGDPLGDDVQIIAVQLPNTLSWDTSGVGKDMYILSALHYIFERARDMAAATPGAGDELPLVVNLSYGWTAGRHDGQSALEQAMQDLLIARRKFNPVSELVLPMGNVADEDLHIILEDADFADDAASFGWQVQPDDRTSSYLEIWFPEGVTPSNYRVRLTPPHGEALDVEAVISADGAAGQDQYVALVRNGLIVGQLSADENAGGRWRVMVALAPTTLAGGQERHTPAGRWIVEISRNSPDTGRSKLPILAWVQRDDDPVGLHTGGRQSRLVNLAQPLRPPRLLQHYRTNLSPVRGYGAFSSIASAPAATRVAGYVAKDQRPAIYSAGAGFTKNLQIWSERATLSAVSDRSNLLNGTMSIGVYSGSHMVMQGTSAACPMATRRMVLNVAADRDLFAGFGGPLTLNPIEDADSAVVRAKFRAQTGDLTAPPLGTDAPPPVAQVMV